MTMVSKYVAAAVAASFAALASPAVAGPGAAQSTAKAPTVPATAADVKAGGPVRDSNGVQIGTMVEAQGANVVLETGQSKIAVPMTILAKDSQGVVLTITADQFNQAIAKARARAEAAKAQQAQQPAQPQQQATPPKQ